MNRTARLSSAALALATVLVGCDHSSATDAPVEVSTNLAALVRTIDGVAFFPPLGASTPPTTGDYDATLTDGLSVLLEASLGNGYETLATFTSQTTPPVLRMDDFRAYVCDVPAARFLTDPSRAYRFRVLYGAAEIGRADLSSYVFTVMQTVPNLTIGVKLHIDLRPAPSITSLEPTRWGTNGNPFTLTVRGASFLSDSIVRLRGTNLATTFVSSSELRAAVPTELLPIAGDYDVTVFSQAPGGGTSNALILPIDNPMAVATFTAPTHVVAGSGDLVLQVFGAPFIAPATATFAGVSVTILELGGTTATVLVPAALLATAGSYRVQITNPPPGGGSNGWATFTVDEFFNPTASVTAIAPASVAAGSGAFTLTVTGSSFLPGAQVSLGSTVLSTTFISANTLTALVPSSVVATGAVLDVTVTNPSPVRGASNAIGLVVLNPVSSVTSLSPASGLVNAGPVTMVVTGGSFVSSSVVYFGATALPTTFVNSTQLTATLSAATLASAGNVSVTVSSDGGATRSNASTFIVGARGVNPQMTSGDFQVCALHADGTVWCSGYNQMGQLGDGTTVDRTRAVKTVGITNATQISTGAYATCARLADSTLRCWGSNTGGNLGNDDRTMIQSSTPVSVFNINTATEVSVGHYFACARRSNGSVVCWGMNTVGNLGNGTTFDAYRPTLVTGVTNATHVAAGYTHACALIADGTVRCWGGNAWGQLGNGTSTNSSTAVTVTGLSGVTQLVATWDVTCALLTDRTVRCWGPNYYGTVGDGTTVTHYAPVAVSGLSNVTQLGGGGSTMCALLADATVRCWGSNMYGTLGNGTTGGQSNVPTTPVGLGATVALSSGIGSHIAATQADGSVLIWGDGWLGALGNGTAAVQNVPFLAPF